MGIRRARSLANAVFLISSYVQVMCSQGGPGTAFSHIEVTHGQKIVAITRTTSTCWARGEEKRVQVI